MKKEIVVEAIRTRPRFKVDTKMSAEEFSKSLHKHIKDRNQTLIGYCNHEVGMVRLIKDKEKFWAPQLQIRIEANPHKKGKNTIRGMFGPNSSIWTLFMFSYGLGGAIILTTGLYGWVELALGIGHYWVWTNLLGALLIVGPFIAAKIGQRIAKGHMDVLRTFIERVLVDEKIIK
ncbi:hypothetical protein [Moheibacter stercoris]|uniref:Uncharacterized protein n=1 Tax=Moheibacter stercoris TaxID=1628251 RepID=A0ABV2LWC6_9FLAO